MARELSKLTPQYVSRETKPGKYGDGGGLWLEIDDGGAKSWSFRYTMDGRAREMGLGPLHTISLKQARDRALECRTLKLDGIDPIEHRRAQRAAQRLAAAKSITFDECRDAYIQAHQDGWRNAKHGAQWTATLKAYATPTIGKLSVSAVDTSLVIKVLEPIWKTKTETASRVRGRIESILDWAKVRGFRDGENPARWRGHLDKLLPKRSKVQKTEHHAALPYAEIGAFVSDLHGQAGVSPAALEFLILTTSRTGETLGARWPEIDMAAKLWTVPGERMKTGREHRVPLSERAIAILKNMEKQRAGADAFVFPGTKSGAPLSNMALLQLLKRMDRGDLTTHGFRSTFKDWCAEQTNFANEISEAALAHIVGDKVEAAYRRGDMFEKRRRLMDAWAKYCSVVRAPADTDAGNVRQLRGQA
jgi:integrase